MVILRRGFTIIECLISILLLAIVMVGGMAFYFYSTGYLAAATHRRIVAEIANARLEQIKNDGYDSLPTPPPGAPVLWENLNVTIGDLPGNQKVYVGIIAGPPVGGIYYKEVRVNITWTEPSRTGNQTMVLDTYIAPR